MYGHPPHTGIGAMVLTLAASAKGGDRLHRPHIRARTARVTVLSATVLIPAHNEEGSIAHLVHACLDQAYPIDITPMSRQRKVVVAALAAVITGTAAIGYTTRTNTHHHAANPFAHSVQQPARSSG